MMYFTLHFFATHKIMNCKSTSDLIIIKKQFSLCRHKCRTWIYLYTLCVIRSWDALKPISCQNATFMPEMWIYATNRFTQKQLDTIVLKTGRLDLWKNMVIAWKVKNSSKNRFNQKFSEHWSHQNPMKQSE